MVLNFKFVFFLKSVLYYCPDQFCPSVFGVTHINNAIITNICMIWVSSFEQVSQDGKKVSMNII